MQLPEMVTKAVSVPLKYMVKRIFENNLKKVPWLNNNVYSLQ